MNDKMEYWVIRTDKEYSPESPFKAQSKEHAENWIDQPPCRGKYRIVKRKTIYCDRCGQEVPFTSKDMSALMIPPDEENPDASTLL